MYISFPGFSEEDAVVRILKSVGNKR